MNINFKGGYFNFNILSKSDWTLSSQSMDNVQSVHGLSGHCPVHLDFIQGVHGQCPDCPLSPWTMSTESMDIVQSGWSHWTLSMDSLDFVQSIHRYCPDCPLSPWTMSRESTESMDFLQTGIQLRLFRVIPCWWSLKSHLVWLTLSKAFLKSRSMR